MLGVRGIFSRKNAFLLYDNYGHALAQETRPEVRQFTMFVDPPFVIITTRINYFI